MDMCGLFVVCALFLLEQNAMELKDFFDNNPRAALAFSGGTDSAYLLWAAVEYGARVKAYYVKSPFQPAFELEDAKRLAAELGAEMEIIELDVLADERIAANSTERCYHCKRAIFSAICKAADRDGYVTVLDGTNASDDPDDRPGMRALRELSVRSPLRECGLAKSDVRRLSREAGLFTHDKPAYACLATRIPTGERITREKLHTTEKAEEYLSALGFRDFRVRYMCGSAKLQLTKADMARAVERAEEINRELKKYYTSVLLDMEVRNEQ